MEVTLQYLKFVKNKCELPIELMNLKNLRCLLMDAMRSLTVIPQQVISNLPLLQLVSMYKGYHSTVIIEDDI